MHKFTEAELERLQSSLNYVHAKALHDDEEKRARIKAELDLQRKKMLAESLLG